MTLNKRGKYAGKRKNGGKPKGRVSHAHFSPREIKTIERMASYGFTIQQFADAFHMSDETFNSRMNQFPEVKAAVLRGRTTAAEAVMKSAYEQAKGKDCPTMTIFWLKTRCGWKEPKQEIEVSTAAPSINIQFGRNAKARVEEVHAAIEKYIDKPAAVTEVDSDDSPKED